MSAAARAAELDISHVLLESASHAANTISHFQKGKHVMAEPSILPLRSTMSFAAGQREDILQTWQHELAKHRVNLRAGAAVAAISGQRGDFLITLATGETLSAEEVVLAIGLQGNIRKLNVPGDDMPGVQYQLDDPEEFKKETIVVVGAGDAGVENALALAEHNRVILINRDEEFAQCKSANFNQLMSEVTRGRIETRISTRTEHIGAGRVDELPLVYVAQTPLGLECIPCHRVIARLGAKPPRQLVESFGVHFPNDDSTAVPQLSEQYESDVPGLYVVGALAGYPLIKQAMNQGYEVVEYIQGNAVEPADEVLLKEKISIISGVDSVVAGIARIRSVLPLFASLTTLQLREFMLDSEVRVLDKGEVIFSRGDYCTSFYSVLEGEVAIQAEGKSGERAAYQIPAGNFFGEMGLLSGRRRSGTAIAGENCVLIETSRRSMLRLLHSVPSVRRSLDEVAIKRRVQNSLGSTMPESDLEYLVQNAKLKQYAVGDVLFSEGDQADGLYLIRRGSVTASRMLEGREVVLGYVPAGQYVGEMAIVTNSTRTATVRAASPTEALLLDAGRVSAVIQRNASVRARLGSRYLERMGTYELLLGEKFSDQVKFLLAHGVGEATDILLIDYAKCIRCDNCEKACADAHGGISRLDREAGPTFEQIHVPNACRHCEHPHCMKDCPPDAIHRSVNGEVFIGDNCIGCGNCQRNCPYDVIQMVARGERKQRSIWQIVMGTNREATVKETSATKIAVKCDLCQGIGSVPLCVNSCPTGAARRASPEVFFSRISNHGADESAGRDE